jgi:hypothetical protein
MGDGAAMGEKTAMGDMGPRKENENEKPEEYYMLTCGILHTGCQIGPGFGRHRRYQRRQAFLSDRDQS